MSKEEEQQKAIAFERAVNTLGQFFEDFLIIAKPDKNILMWRESDHTFGLGAAHRYLETRNNEDFFDLKDQVKQQEQ